MAITITKKAQALKATAFEAIKSLIELEDNGRISLASEAELGNMLYCIAGIEIVEPHSMAHSK